MTPSVGFIGLGAMGGPMARHILSAGFPVTVHDLRRESATALPAAGAQWADGPAEVARHCDVVLTCLPTPEAVDAVTLDLLDGLAPGKALFEMSTNAPDRVLALAARFAQRGIDFLDAPVTGGALGAARGRLTVFVGGPEAPVSGFTPVLRAFADRVVHVGPAGTGTVTKLVNNCASQTLYLMLAEIFALGLKAGAEPLPLWEALRSGAAGRRRLFDGMIDEFLPGRFDPPNAALMVFLKDMTLATDLARDLAVPMPFAELALQGYRDAMDRGWGGSDGRRAMTLALERLGLMLAEDPDAIARILDRDPPAPSDSKRGKA